MGCSRYYEHQLSHLTLLLMSLRPHFFWLAILLGVAFIGWYQLGVSLADPDAYKDTLAKAVATSATEVTSQTASTTLPSPVEVDTQTNQSKRSKYSATVIEALKKKPISKTQRMLLDVVNQTAWKRETTLAKRAERENPRLRQVLEGIGCSESQISEIMALADKRRRTEVNLLLEHAQHPSPSEWDVVEVSLKRDEENEKINAQIKSVLSDPEKIRRYELWNKTAAPRGAVAGLEERLGRTFTTQQAELMVDVVGKSYGDFDALRKDPSNVGIRQKVLAEWRQKMGGLLSPSEMEDFLTRMSTSTKSETKKREEP
jgi:hypothetical protein